MYVCMCVYLEWEEEERWEGQKLKATHKNKKTNEKNEEKKRKKEEWKEDERERKRERERAEERRWELRVLTEREAIDEESKLAAFHFEERYNMQKHNSVYIIKEQMVKKEWKWER